MNNIFGAIEFGGSGMVKEVFDYINAVLPYGQHILELGSGHVSTPALGGPYKLTSVEENEDFLNTGYPTNYIYCPVARDGWYNRVVLQYALKRIDPYQMLIIDGPDGSNRGGFYENRDLFNLNGWILIDDVWREPDMEMARRLASELGREMELVHEFEQGWQTAVIKP